MLQYHCIFASPLILFMAKTTFTCTAAKKKFRLCDYWANQTKSIVKPSEGWNESHGRYHTVSASRPSVFVNSPPSSDFKKDYLSSSETPSKSTGTFEHHFFSLKVPLDKTANVCCILIPKLLSGASPGSCIAAPEMMPSIPKSDLSFVGSSKCSSQPSQLA